MEDSHSQTNYLLLVLLRYISRKTYENKSYVISWIFLFLKFIWLCFIF